MNKKMLKRSMALGVLMAFVITGSAMAADENYRSTMLDKDVTVTGGNLTYEATDKGADNPLGEGANRSYALGVVDGGSHTITLDEGKTLYIKNSLEGTARNYGIVSSANKKANSLTVNGNVEIKVAGKKNQHVRGIRNSGENGTMVFNGDVHIVADIKNPSNGGYITGVDTWSGSKTYFNGNTVIDITSGKGENIAWSNVWANALQLNQGGYIAFSGEKCIMNVSNNGYTAQGLSLNAYKDLVEFKNDTTVINCKSDYGATGISGMGKVVFSGKDVTINSYITDGVGNSNVIGIFTPAEVTSNVENFTINLEGTGAEKSADGTAGIVVDTNEITNINSSNLTINIISGKSTNNSTFNPDDVNAENYSEAYGLKDFGGQINVGVNTKTNIDVYDSQKDAIAVYSQEGGNVNVLGDAFISATGVDVAKALYATSGGLINVGSEGKTISLVGNVLSNGKNDSGKVSTINLHGNSVFDGAKTQFIATDGGSINLAGGNMSGVLNIAKDSKVNLTGATFTANDLENSITGGGKLVISGNGKLETMSGQIFEKGIAQTDDKAVFDSNDSGKINGVASDRLEFVGGSVVLNDAKYSDAYLTSAQSALGNDTTLIMNGTLVTEDGVNNESSVDNVAAKGENVIQNNVTAQAEKNLLVGQKLDSVDTVEGIEIKDSVEQGFGVSDLNMAAGSTGLVITDNAKVTLVGTNGDLITVGGQVSEKLDVIVGTTEKVGTASSMTGTLNIGNDKTDSTLTGNVVVNGKESSLNVNGNASIKGDLTLNNGTVNAVNGNLNTDIKVEAGNANTITGNVNVGTVTGVANSVINIGNDRLAGNVVVKNANLNGAVVFLDPVFGNGIEDSSKLAVKESAILNGHYVSGQNSVMGFGVDNTADADKMFAKTGLEWKNDVIAAAYVAGTTNVANGSVVVNGSLTSAPTASSNGTVSFADKSLLMVDGSKIQNTAALSGVKESSVDKGAKLYIDGAKKGETYKILAGTGINGVWELGNVISDNGLLKFEAVADNGANKFDVTASLKKVNDVYDNQVIIDSVVDNTLDKVEGSAAAAFFNKAVSDKVNASQEAQISALNSAGAMSELAGVAHSTYAVSNILTDAVADHVSLSNEFEHDSDIWAHYVHNKENVENLSVANFGADYDAQYNGIVVGGDFYKKDNVVAGAALTYVDGNINGNSLAARTENDAEFYGVSVYGSVTNGDNAVIGDISYLHGKHDITQRNSGIVMTGEPESDAFSVGVRVEKAVDTEAGKFVPYAGLRYLHVGTGNYTNSIGMSYDAEDANLFLLPVGLKYSAETKAGKWIIRPVAEVGYVWAMGDTDSTQTVSLNGAADGFGYDITDSGSYFARIGIKAESNNVTYGLGYEYQKGDSIKANKWTANLNFTF